MIIQFHKNFDKQYTKLSFKLQRKVDEVLERFIADPYDKSLKNHSLQGRLKNQRAFWVTGNIRVIFEEHKNYAFVIMLNIGTHNQVY